MGRGRKFLVVLNEKESILLLKQVNPRYVNGNRYRA